jgi:hypothetical protein
MATSDEVAASVEVLVNATNTLINDISGTTSRQSKLTPEQKATIKKVSDGLKTVKQTLLDYLSPKTVQLNLEDF